MRIALISVCLVAVAALSVSVAGCGCDSSETPTNKVAGTSPPLDADAEHNDHAGHGHGAHAGHEHPTERPHGGHLIELGNGHYRAELLHDQNTHTVAIHLLDGTGKQAVAVPLAEITLQLFRDGHMFSDMAALGLSLFAVCIAERPPTPRRTCGCILMRESTSLRLCRLVPVRNTGASHVTGPGGLTVNRSGLNPATRESRRSAHPAPRALGLLSQRPNPGWRYLRYHAAGNTAMHRA